MKYYVVTFTHTRILGWLLYLYAHIKYLKRLIKQGKLQVSGPGLGTPIRSAQLVFNVTDKDELNRLVNNDPFSIHGLVASSTVNLWDVKYGSMLKPDTPDSEGTKYFRGTYCLKDGVNTSSVEQARDNYIRLLMSKRKLRASGNYVGNVPSGLTILSVASFLEAEDIMKHDPYVAQLGATYQVTEWNPLFGEFK